MKRLIVMLILGLMCSEVPTLMETTHLKNKTNKQYDDADIIYPNYIPTNFY
jgi:hypothetical protein